MRYHTVTAFTCRMWPASCRRVAAAARWIGNTCPAGGSFLCLAGRATCRTKSVSAQLARADICIQVTMRHAQCADPCTCALDAAACRHAALAAAWCCTRHNCKMFVGSLTHDRVLLAAGPHSCHQMLAVPCCKAASISVASVSAHRTYQRGAQQLAPVIGRSSLHDNPQLPLLLVVSYCCWPSLADAGVHYHTQSTRGSDGGLYLQGTPTHKWLL